MEHRAVFWPPHLPSFWNIHVTLIAHLLRDYSSPKHKYAFLMRCCTFISSAQLLSLLGLSWCQLWSPVKCMIHEMLLSKSPLGFLNYPDKLSSPSCAALNWAWCDQCSLLCCLSLRLSWRTKQQQWNTAPSWTHCSVRHEGIVGYWHGNKLYFSFPLAEAENGLNQTLFSCNNLWW